MYVMSLMSLLGTPPTLGFFAKVLTFYIIAQKSYIALALTALLTLILIIFYLQSVRAGNTHSRKLAWLSNKQTPDSSIILIYGQLTIVIFTLATPYIFDIIYSVFI